jgi:hypothetical protein
MYIYHVNLFVKLAYCKKAISSGRQLKQKTPPFFMKGTAKRFYKAYKMVAEEIVEMSQ